MASITVPFDFVMQRTTLTWREACVGIERGWMKPKDAIELARRRTESLSPATTLEYNLADRKEDDPVLETVRKLSESEPEADDRDITNKWMRLVLLWIYHRREHLRDLFAVIEDMYCSFGHPAELHSFIPYMPPDDPIATGKRTYEENIALLRARWEKYMEDLDRQMTSEHNQKRSNQAL